MVPFEFMDGIRGKVSVQLNNGNVGKISQTVTVTPGTLYVLSFWLAGDSGFQGVQYIRVTANSLVRGFSIDSTGTTSSTLGWTLKTLEFIPTSSSLALSFESLQVGVYGPYIDGVTLKVKSIFFNF